MTKEKLEMIKESVMSSKKCTDKILMGDSDNYDGADGARKVQDLCYICEELIEELEKYLV